MIKIAFYDTKAYDKPSFENIVSYYENDGICDNELCYRCGNIEKCKKERKQRCF